MSIHKRKRLYIDPQVQGALLRRTFFYWAFGVLGLLGLLTVWEVFQDPRLTLGEAFYDCLVQNIPVLVISLILLPIVMYDTLKTSNRVTGPLYRLRQEMKKLASGQGEEVHPLRFRDGDFWGDLADEYNRILNQVRTQDDRMKDYFEKAPEVLPENLETLKEESSRSTPTHV